MAKIELKTDNAVSLSTNSSVAANTYGTFQIVSNLTVTGAAAASGLTIYVVTPIRSSGDGGDFATPTATIVPNSGKKLNYDFIDGTTAPSNGKGLISNDQGAYLMIYWDAGNGYVVNASGTWTRQS